MSAFSTKLEMLGLSQHGEYSEVLLGNVLFEVKNCIGAVCTRYSMGQYSLLAGYLDAKMRVLGEYSGVLLGTCCWKSRVVLELCIPVASPVTSNVKNIESVVWKICCRSMHRPV